MRGWGGGPGRDRAYNIVGRGRNGQEAARFNNILLT